MGEGWADVIQMATQFDPDVVDFVEMVQELSGSSSSAPANVRCVITNDTADAWSPWVNDVAVDRNAGLGLWEFLDADNASASGDGPGDFADFQIVDLMTAANTYYLASGDPYENRKNGEHVREPYLTCTEAADCPSLDWSCTANQCRRSCSSHNECGPVETGVGGEPDAEGFWCVSYECRHGDLQGENVRDWVEYLPTPSGAPGGWRWKTLENSWCVGEVTNSYPYQGGFRGD